MEEIERRAESILAELPDYIWDGDRPPIPVEEIADSTSAFTSATCRRPRCATPRAARELDDGETLSGLLLPALGEIWVNADEAVQWPPRRRFTIAHELGHHVLHRTGQQSLFCRKASVDEGRSAGNDPPAAPGHRAGGQRLRRRAADAGRRWSSATTEDAAATSSSSAWCSSRAARRWGGGCMR